MRFHIDCGKTFQAMLAFQIRPPAQRNIKSAIRQLETLAPRPMARRSPQLELPSQNAGIVEDSAMISASMKPTCPWRRCWRPWLNFAGTMPRTPSGKPTGGVQGNCRPIAANVCAVSLVGGMLSVSYGIHFFGER